MELPIDRSDPRDGDPMKTRIPYTKPSITQIELDYAADAAAFGWGERCYEYIVEFERLFREHLGARHSIATSSCTGAMHLGLAGLGIGAGDEVILANTNWIASAAPMTYLGATPVLVDILPDSWCIDPKAAEIAITSRTKAIIAVHLYGNVCDMAELQRIGDEHGIPIIEDAAEAIGSKLGEARCGSMGSFGTFSFHGTKTVSTGEGGMFVTNDSELYERVLTLSNHGRSRTQTKQFWPDAIGYKYKMSNIQAALGCGQLKRVEELIAGKRRVFEYYARGLKNCPVAMNPEPPGVTNGYWMPTIVIDPSLKITREPLIEAFREELIDARVFFWPLSSLGLPLGRKESTPIAEEIVMRAMNLPSFHDITDEELSRVVKVVQNVLG